MIDLRVVLAPDVGDGELQGAGQFLADPVEGIQPRAAAGVLARLDPDFRNVPDELADRRLGQRNKAARNNYFAWSGGINPSDPRYYRIQTPSFLIEFDDTQDNANHIHSVWRDFNGDFGEDLLQQHYSASHNQGIFGHRGDGTTPHL